MKFLESGSFVTGVNYWASHAATEMWSRWDEGVVEADFAALSKCGVRAMRVFPVWPDFQPITRLVVEGSPVFEFRFGREPLPDTEAGRAGVDELMMARFEKLADLAGKYGISLIVALLTGHMSTSLMIPPALVGLHPVTSPLAQVWERRFVRYFVKRMKDHAAIVAWDFGNECNYLRAEGKTAEPYAASHWMASLVDAIKGVDPSRPIVSGMGWDRIEDSIYSESYLGSSKLWSLQNQAENCDALCSHCYFGPWTQIGSDPCSEVKPLMGPAVEIRMAEDIAGKPSFMEEIGLAWRPIMADAAGLASYVRGNLWHHWADDCRGLLWWCAFDQEKMRVAPYEWDGPGLEHGVMSSDRKTRPSGEELRKFAEFLDGLPFERLPAPKRKAVCLLGDFRQKHQAAATGAYILAKKAGFDIEFQLASQELKPAQLYLLPCATGKAGFTGASWDALKKAVREGASLYISTDNVYLQGLSEVFQAEVVSQTAKSGSFKFQFDGFSLTLPLKYSYKMNSLGAKALGSWPDGSPAFFEAKYGKGRVFLLSFPLESSLVETPLAFQGEESSEAWRIYAHIGAGILSDRVAIKDSPDLSLVERPLSKDEIACVAVNHSSTTLRSSIALKNGWRLKECRSYCGSASEKAGKISLTLDACSGALITIKRE